MENQSRLKWTDKVKYLNDVMQLKSVFWVNDAKLPFEEAAKQSAYSKAHVDDAEARLARFAPYIATAFPETAESNGLIESELTKIDNIKEHLEDYYDTKIQGDLYLKRDDTLPIAGTIKARGAIYEVLKHAETLAIEHGLLSGFEDDYTKFASDEFKQFFSEYKVVVGTTGNLGISVGVMGAKLGFEATVHMSIEAKQWKKDLLRSRGVTVIEHNTNFTEAVRNGRQQSDADPKSYFVDDEHSVELFLGYTVAANRLKRQLDDLGIVVDAEHPLFVYSPCGIGGSPGGTAFGLKQVYGDNVHCFFAQPAHMPSMIVGQITEAFDGVSVADFDVDGKTGMDGLAVPRTSGFVAELMKDFFDGGYTLQEEEAYHFLAQMIDLEDIRLEPAALAGVPGTARMFTTEEGRYYIESRGLADKMNQATHIAWATGGSMVPDEDMDNFYQLGKNNA
ncbi:D-serine ammonia-lyase [Tuanshanicoccus lijuaniae]|uniref:D-serine ammonia-lyase n=1 Tax=Aerococcaceae bacterium zg-1292 TaxID=2774330 RepID=UPI001BD7FA3B|nr:D-serine ammonia-lyase [Aerococcaceae bacterium zg-BR22]MBS4455247.1 D-serine ammonia-lyase [Aerococcaceae bacterium zg-A91]MBS4457943.1 D-serine ammonia-lyase [Aerococcaceae bacterium zg-BR33]